MAKNIKDFFKKLFPDKTTEIDALEDITIPEATDSQSSTPTQTQPTNVSDPAIKSLLDTQAAQIKQLTDMLTNMKSQSDAQAKLLTDKATADLNASIEAIIAKAVEEKKIPAKNEELKNHYKTLLQTNMDSAKQIISALPAINNDQTGSQTNNQQQTQTQTARQSGNRFLDHIMKTGNIIAG